jgi:integrase
LPALEAVKVRAEQLIPLSAKAAAAIRDQQDYVRQHWPAGSPWLFPGIAGNHDGSRPYSHSNFTKQLTRWQHVIGLRDEAGQPVTVTGHQFRHTLVICTALKARGTAQSWAGRIVPHKYLVLGETRTTGLGPGSFFFDALFGLS